MRLDEKETCITGFQEKPVYEIHVAMGVNAFNRSVVEQILAGEFFGFDLLLLKLLDQKIPVRSYRFDGRWLHIGRPDDYDRMCLLIQENPDAFLLPGAQAWRKS